MESRLRRRIDANEGIVLALTVDSPIKRRENHTNKHMCAAETVDSGSCKLILSAA